MKNLEDYKQILTPEEICEILRISKASLYKRNWEGQLPIFKLGRSIRMDKNKLIFAVIMWI